MILDAAWLGANHEKLADSAPTLPAPFTTFIPDHMHAQLTELDLRRVSAAAQCLDDQWVPRDMLDRMIAEGLSYEDVRDERDVRIRTEYLRSLINADQVVVNRAYLYNTPAVFRDFVDDGDERAAFRELVLSRALLPFLYNERTPADEPHYRVDPVGFAAWQRFCAETPPSCVRLSWDDDENARLGDIRLKRRFNMFITTMRQKDPLVFARGLNLGDGAAEELRLHLRRIARFQLDMEEEKGFITRADLYREFVNVPGTTPAEGKFDGAKPYCAAIKQLFDLNYNVNLPDALNAFALTPVDSPPRTVLQEFAPAGRKTSLDADELMRVIRNFAFEKVQAGLSIRSMHLLSLSDVVKVRRTDEWREYIQRMAELLDDPFSFANPDAGAMGVYNAYAALARQLTDQAVKRHVREATAEWQPRIELAINVLGKVLKIVWAPAGLVIDLAGKVVDEAAKRALPVVIEFSIRNFREGGADLGFTSEIFRGTLDDAGEQIRLMESRLGEMAHAERRIDVLPGFRQSNLSMPEAA